MSSSAPTPAIAHAAVPTPETPSKTPSTSVGFVGVGTISAAMIEAMLAGPHAATLAVQLSPRSAARSANLAARFTQATVHESNQAVVDASDIVVMGVLPDQLAEVCGSLQFREGQIVVSLAGGWPPSAVQEFVRPATTVCQMIPLPMIAEGYGPIVLYPAVPEVARLLDDCGDVVSPASDKDILVFSCLSSAMSAFFAVQNTLIDWATSEHGIENQLAATYVTSMFHGLARQAAHADPSELPGFPVAHETPGGLNAQIREGLVTNGGADAITAEFERLYRSRSQV